MQSRSFQVGRYGRLPATFPPPSPAPSFAGSGFSFPGGHRHLRPRHTPGVLPINTSTPVYAPTGHAYAASPASLRSQMSTLPNVAPSPILSLQTRLRFIPPEQLQLLEQKASMKSVDNLADHFDLVFTGDPGQDWMNHVNELERQQATRHQ